MTGSTERTFHARGKLLLTGEYAVLDGALALAVPTKLGQRLHVHSSEARQRRIHWKSFEEDGTLWFEVWFDKNLAVLSTTDQAVAERLQSILVAAIRYNPDFLSEDEFLEVETQLEFNRQWGLGSSSTLLSLIAQWAEVDSFALLQDTLGGSGYDVACATAEGPLVYQLLHGEPAFSSVQIPPVLREVLSFLYLGAKQNSRAEVARYRERSFDRNALVKRVSELTQKLLQVTDRESAQRLLHEHEELLSSALDYPPVQSTRFPNFRGVVKSLGAWGGDFVAMIPDEGQTVPEQSIPYRTLVQDQ